MNWKQIIEDRLSWKIIKGKISHSGKFESLDGHIIGIDFIIKLSNFCWYCKSCFCFSAQEDSKGSAQKLVTADGTYATQSAFTSKTGGTGAKADDKRYGEL